jgi:PST family polysaccharide transporter
LKTELGLFKTSIVSSVGISVKIFSMLILNKVLAVYVGPSGYVAIGQLQNVMQLFGAFSTTSLHSGVVKYTAEYSSKNNFNGMISIWRAVNYFSILTSIVFLLLILFFGDRLTIKMFGHADFSQPLLIFAITFVLMSLNNQLLAILNGRREVVRLAIANAIGSVISLIFTFFLVTGWGLSGALVAVASYQGVWLVGTLFLCSKRRWFKLSNFFGKFSLEPLRKLSGYFAMALVTACAVPVMQILIRGEIIGNYSLTSAGHWEAMLRLSAVYGLFFSSVLGVYFLPKFTTINTSRALIVEILNGYKLIIPIITGFFFCVFLLRQKIVFIAYSDAFLPLVEMFFWVLVGDFFKICSWLLSYVLVAKSLSKLFIISEIMFTGIFVALSVYALKFLSFEAVFEAYALGYLLYFLYLAFLLFRKNGIAFHLKIYC